MMRNVTNNIALIGVISIVYFLLSVLVIICMIIGPVAYVNERLSWSTSNCTCVDSNLYEEDDFNYFTATFDVYWMNGTVLTTSTGITPNIIGEQDITIGTSYLCAIDPSSGNTQPLSVFPTTWLNHWHHQMIVYNIITPIILICIFITLMYLIIKLFLSSTKLNSIEFLDLYQLNYKHLY